MLRDSMKAPADYDIIVSENSEFGLFQKNVMHSPSHL